MDFILDHPGTCIVALVVVTLLGLAFTVQTNNSYLKSHHCHRTGRAEVQYFQNIGTVMVPIYNYEYQCDGGLTWR